MFNHLLYWLGDKSCAAIGFASQFVLAELLCSRQQTWNLGAVVSASTVLVVVYWIIRWRR